MIAESPAALIKQGQHHCMYFFLFLWVNSPTVVGFLLVFISDFEGMFLICIFVIIYESLSCILNQLLWKVLFIKGKNITLGKPL